MFESTGTFFALSESATRKDAHAASRLIICILLAVSALKISFIGLSDFSTRGEAREAIVVQSMISSGNWLLPSAYNESIPSKPPLFHWISAVASLPFEHVTEFTARLPSVLFAVSALGLFLFMLKGFFSPRELLVFALLLTFSFEWLRASMSARVDMVHASCLSAGLLMSFFALESSKSRYWVAASMLFALATLGKGPVAIVIPAAILSLWALTTFENRRLHLVSIFTYLSCSVLFASTWYIAAYYQAPEEFIGRLWYENVNRFTSTMEDGPHRHSVFYLLGMLLIGLLPWSAYLIGVYRTKWNTLPHLLRNTKSLLRGSSRLVQFSLLSIGFIFLFYCIPSSKRSVYLLAAYPFIAIILTTLLSSHVSNRFLRRAICLGIAVVALFQGIVLPFLIAPRGSERGIGQIIAHAIPHHRKAYSYGFEFYGAAFYSNLLFLRLEDSFQSDRRSPINGDIVVCFEDDIQHMNELLKLHAVQLNLLFETTLSNRGVKIFQFDGQESAAVPLHDRSKGERTLAKEAHSI